MPGKALTDKIRAERAEKFLQALAECGCIKDALAKSGLPKATAYEMRAADETFKARWNVALEAGYDALESEATRRAVTGVKEPVYQGGKLVGHVTKYSDTLLMFLLNGGRPEKYKHRHEHTGAGGKPLVPTAREMSDDELLTIIAARRGRGGNGTAREETSTQEPGQLH